MTTENILQFTFIDKVNMPFDFSTHPLTQGSQGCTYKYNIFDSIKSPFHEYKSLKRSSNSATTKCNNKVVETSHNNTTRHQPANVKMPIHEILAHQGIIVAPDDYQEVSKFLKEMADNLDNHRDLFHVLGLNMRKDADLETMKLNIHNQNLMIPEYEYLCKVLKINMILFVNTTSNGIDRHAFKHGDETTYFVYNEQVMCNPPKLELNRKIYDIILHAKMMKQDVDIATLKVVELKQIVQLFGEHIKSTFKKNDLVALLTKTVKEIDSDI